MESTIILSVFAALFVIMTGFVVADYWELRANHKHLKRAYQNYDALIKFQ